MIAMRVPVHLLAAALVLLAACEGTGSRRESDATVDRWLAEERARRQQQEANLRAANAESQRTLDAELAAARKPIGPAERSSVTDAELARELDRARHLPSDIDLPGGDQAAYVAALEVEFFRRYPLWSEEVREAIRRQDLLVGFTREQVLASWGAPGSWSRTLTATGQAEVWVFAQNLLQPIPAELTFVNDRLTTIHVHGNR